MSDSAALQASIARMLSADGQAAPSEDIGWRVYRNTIMRGALDALLGNFPSVAKLVGGDWFEACARIFVLRHPPATPCLLDYGAAFPDFLADFEPAEALPYLADVALMDRWWSQAHVAADAPAWTRQQFEALDSRALARVPVTLHPSLRFGAFAQRSPSVWLYNRTTAPCRPPVFDASPEALLVVRPAAVVEYRRASPDEVQLLTLAQAGCPLLKAARAVAGANTAADALLVGLVDTGVFVLPRTGASS